jgi:hypothetical protein
MCDQLTSPRPDIEKRNGACDAIPRLARQSEFAGVVSTFRELISRSFQLGATARLGRVRRPRQGVGSSSPLYSTIQSLTIRSLRRSGQKARVRVRIATSHPKLAD